MTQNLHDPTRFQSRVLLPFARRAFLLLAGAAFIAMTGALVTAAYFWFTSSTRHVVIDQSPPTLSATELKSALEAAAPLSMDIFTLNESDRSKNGILVAEISSNEASNEISSATASEIADNGLFFFQLPPENGSGIVRLFTTGEFWATFAHNADTANSAKEYEVTIDYIDAREASDRATFRFHVPFRSVTRPGAQARRDTAARATPPTKAELTAQEIAELVDPEITTTYFDTYSAVLDRIQSCHADENGFADVLRNEVRTNPAYFSDSYSSISVNRVCTQWRAAIDAAAATQRAVMQRRQQNEADAIEKRRFALTSLFVSLGALAAFFVVIFPLSHLAMEDHLRAIRDKQ